MIDIFNNLPPRAFVVPPSERLERHLARLVRWAERTRPEALAYLVAVSFRHYKRKVARLSGHVENKRRQR